MPEDFRIVLDRDGFKVQKLCRPLIWPFWKRWITLSADGRVVGFFWPGDNTNQVIFASIEEAQRWTQEKSTIR